MGVKIQLMWQKMSNFMSWFVTKFLQNQNKDSKVIGDFLKTVKKFGKSDIYQVLCIVQVFPIIKALSGMFFISFYSAFNPLLNKPSLNPECTINFS